STVLPIVTSLGCACGTALRDRRALRPGYFPRLRRWIRVFLRSLRCFFFAMRLRRFLMTEPTGPPCEQRWMSGDGGTAHADPTAYRRSTVDRSPGGPHGAARRPSARGTMAARHGGHVIRPR